ncbi:MAG: hypothetical protein LUI12_10080 [Clostridiales bacterium]|nr:hypothetical protein [Clostridiales bacterium]
MRVDEIYTERNYYKEFLWLWIKAAFIYFIGGYVCYLFQGTFAKDMAFAVSATVFGFTFFEKIVRFNLFGNHDAVILFWAFKIICSFIIGILVFPIVNIYYIIMIIRSIMKKNSEGEELKEE